MKPIRRILVPTDFVSSSRRAIEYGVSLANRLGASLTVAHVVEYPTALSYVFPLATFVLEEHHTEEVEEKLRELIPVPTRHELDYRFVVKAGHVADEILDLVQEEEADLIVMGTHGRRQMAKWLLGSVAERMLRQVPVPLVTLSHSGDSADMDRLPHKHIRRILYATDLSEGSGQGLRFADDLRSAYGAELLVVHVLSPLRWDYPSHHVPLDVRHEHQRLRTDLSTMLEQSIPEGLRKDAAVSWHLGDGLPWKVILELADNRGSDLIVVNIRARARAERALLGTTAERIVRGAECPVLSIPLS